MADQLYLSLWFPDFQLAALPAKLSAVMRQFAAISGQDRVVAATAYPIAFSEPPVYQRLYVHDDRAEDSPDARIDNAVAEATEQLHDDTAYEFEMRWKLWTPDSGFGNELSSADEARLDALWRPEPATVKVIGFGPAFDDATFAQNGHIRVDFGLDYPWVLDDENADDSPSTTAVNGAGNPSAADLESDSDVTASSARGTGKVVPFPGGRADPAPTVLSDATEAIRRNIEMLLAFTLSVEKHGGISSRLLWTESGEPLAEKLIARLQRLH